MKYDVCIQETLSKTITVEAESNTDACSMIRERLRMVRLSFLPTITPVVEL